METTCALVAAGVDCGDQKGFEDAKKQGLDADAENWSLLLQINSMRELGMTWGDLGKLYFWIKNDDLQSARFAGVRMIMQCS